MHNGRLDLASVLVVLALWAVPTLQSWFVVGLSGDRALFTYPFVIFLSGLLLGPRGAIAFTVLTILGLWGAYAAERAGEVPLVLEPISAQSLATMFGVLVITGVLTRYAVINTANALVRARQNAEAQAEANRRLQVMQSSLESRVEERTEALAHRSRLLQAGAEVGRLAASMRVTEELLSEVAANVRRRFDYYVVNVFLLDRSGEHAVLRETSSEETPLPGGYQVEIQASTVIGQVVRERSARVALAPNIPRTVFGIGEERISGHAPLLQSTDLEIVLPLIVGDRVIGVLDLHTAEHGDFDIDDLEPLQIMADQIAVAIENANLIAESEAALAAERRFYQQQSRESWMDFLRGGFVPGFQYVNRAIEPIGDDWLPEMQEVMARDDRVVQPPRDDGEKGAVVAAPIRVRGETIGVLDLRKDAESGPWTSQEIELLETLTNQLETALENARLYQDTQKRALREQLTRRITDRIRSSLTVEDAMRRAVEELARIAGASELVARVGTERSLLERTRSADQGDGHE
jgi:GAF domain-containing protein